MYDDIKTHNWWTSEEVDIILERIIEEATEEHWDNYGYIPLVEEE